MSLNYFCPAQQKNATHQSLDLAATVGQSQGSFSASYVYIWKLGKRQKWEIGLGLRSTTYLGSKTDYITAPANLARTSTLPFIIVFSGQREENFDTLTVQIPFTNSVNLTANIGYNLSKKWLAGFNIDLIGFTVGRKGTAILQSNGTTRTEPNAKPTSFNLLLTGDNDIGSLNSEFFLKYKIAPKGSIRGIYQFLFSEYKTETVKQIAPDGTQVDRFRNKVSAFGLGLTYNFQNQKNK